MTAGRKKHNWCVGERRPTGPDLIFYLPGDFQTRAEAEKERDRLAVLPEKAGYMLFVTKLPESKPKPRQRRGPSRRTRR